MSFDARKRKRRKIANSSRVQKEYKLDFFHGAKAAFVLSVPIWGGIIWGMSRIEPVRKAFGFAVNNSLEIGAGALVGVGCAVAFGKVNQWKKNRSAESERKAYLDRIVGRHNKL